MSPSLGNLEDRLVAILRASPRVMTVLETLRALDPPDWRLFSGGVYQTVWNALSGRDPDYGVKDYDIGYFDPDVSWDAEDRVIEAVAAAFPAPLDALVEVRNQARVHLWFADRFGDEDYPALDRTDAALERFLCPAFAVGVRLEADDRISVAAPFGLDDVFALRLRPTPGRPRRAESLQRVCASAQARWPQAVVEIA
jgi:hypothetical protein